MRLNPRAHNLLKEWILSQEHRYSILTEDLAKFICELVLDTPTLQDVSERLAGELDVFFQERTAEFLKDLSECLRLKTYLPRDRELTKAQQLAVQNRPKRSAAQSVDSQDAAVPSIGDERAPKLRRIRAGDAAHVQSSGITAPASAWQPFAGTGVGPMSSFSMEASSHLGLHAVFAGSDDFYQPLALSTADIVARIRAAQASEACELFSRTGICLLGKSCPFKHETANAKHSTNTTQPDGPRQDLQSLSRKYGRAQQRHREHDRRRADLQLELLNVDADRMSLLARLAAKERAGQAGAAAADHNADGMSMPDLRAKLASLKAEAVSLGLNEDGSTRTARPPQLRYSRAAHPRHASAHAFESVLRVDHRPKTVAITLADTDRSFADAATAGALRAFLRSIGPMPRLDAAAGARCRRLASYDARFLAERVGDVVARLGGRVPGLGRVELAWADALDDSGALEEDVRVEDARGAADDLLAGPVDLDVD